MSIKRAQQMIQIFIGILILVVGSVTAITVTDVPSAPSREPASFSAPIEPKTLPKEIEVIHLNCEDQTYETSRVSQVRLSGQICRAQSTGSVKHSRVRNLSTNSEALVFFLEKSNHFTTDLLPVQAGTNSIEIQNDFDGGQTQSLRINIMIQ